MENRGWLLAVYHCFRIFGTMLKKSGTLHGSLAYLKLMIDLRFNMHTELTQWLCTTNDMDNVCYVMAGSEASEQPVDRIRTY